MNHQNFFAPSAAYQSSHVCTLLRNPHNKPDAFEDMLALQSKIREICTHTYDGTEL